MDVLGFFRGLVVLGMVGLFAWAAVSVFLGSVGVFFIHDAFMFLPALIGIPLGRLAHRGQVGAKTALT